MRFSLIANLIGQLAFGLLAMTICLPSLQQWPALFGAGQAQVQLTFGGYVAAYGVLQLIYGAVSDRIGRKPMLLLGLTLALLGSLWAALASSLWSLIAARVMQGAGAAAGLVIGRALVQDLFVGSERTRVTAWIGMTMGVCPPLAMVLGGQLHMRFGWQANFVVMAVLAAVLWVAAWRGLPSVRPASDPAATAAASGSGLLAGYRLLFRQPDFVLYVLILAMTNAAFYSFLSGAPIVFAGYGITPGRVGLFMMTPPLAYILGNLLASRLLKRGDRFLMTLGQAIAIGGLMIVLALGLAGVHTPLALALPIMLLGLGFGMLMPSALTGTVGLMPALAGSAAAVAGLMQQLLGALGGFVVGLIPLDGPSYFAALMLGWALCGALAQALLFARGGGANRRPARRTK
ncbi:MAG: MFS transporter [Lautropia sp.]